MALRQVFVVLLGFISSLTKGQLQGVPIMQDDDQNSTDLMKCVDALSAKETSEGLEVRKFSFFYRGHGA